MQKVSNNVQNRLENLNNAINVTNVDNGGGCRGIVSDTMMHSRNTIFGISEQEVM
jgi:hypothetical protein